MILAVLDDLMFTSKIRTAANQVGATVRFARSADAARREMETAAPALVIFDLNNTRIDPLAIVRWMKSNPSLGVVPTVGFVSHVQTELIEAARTAGVTDVLARSAFSQHVGEILRRV